MMIKWIKLRLFYSWFASCHSLLSVFIIMGPFIIGAVIMMIWDNPILFIIAALLMIVSVVFRDSPADRVGYEEGNRAIITRKILSEEWMLRGKNFQLIKIETLNSDQTMIAFKVYGYDLREDWFKRDLFGRENYSRCWTMESTWFDWKWNESRPLTKREKEKYNVNTLQAKIMLGDMI